MNKLIALLILTFSTSLFSQNTEWTLDKTHSTIQFKVGYMLISNVVGNFKNFDGVFKSNGENFDGSSVDFNIETASINTDNDKRDDHLRSDDFFESEKFPLITFKSKSFKKVSDKKFKVTGDFTMRGVTKQIDLDVTHTGTIKDNQGKTRAGFNVKTTVNRMDYGVNWSRTLDVGGLVVADDVELDGNVIWIMK